ncbi:ATP-binding protein [Streptomyces sp. NPDC050743]|uniref:ATP-binding protein n=1 Tax=Streptomyces sp. NPDC050743 TaxID=3365634 RepID=UPI00379DF2F1
MPTTTTDSEPALAQPLDTAQAPAAGRRTSQQTSSDLAFLARALKAPALLEAADRLGERARKESWTHAEYLVACLQREVAARESHGGEARVRAARFPAVKTLEELDVTHLRGLTRQQLSHLGTLDFIVGKENVVFLGPPGTGKTHLAIGLGVRACQAGHRVAFATAAEWVDRLAAAHQAGNLAAELTRLGRYPLIVVDLCRHRDYAERAGSARGKAPMTAVPLCIVAVPSRAEGDLRYERRTVVSFDDGSGVNATCLGRRSLPISDRWPS